MWVQNNRWCHTGIHIRLYKTQTFMSGRNSWNVFSRYICDICNAVFCGEIYFIHGLKHCFRLRTWNKKRFPTIEFTKTVKKWNLFCLHSHPGRPHRWKTPSCSVIPSCGTTCVRVNTAPYTFPLLLEQGASV